jgi:hypothetical protein
MRHSLRQVASDKVDRNSTIQEALVARSSQARETAQDDAIVGPLTESSRGRIYSCEIRLWPEMTRIIDRQVIHDETRGANDHRLSRVVRPWFRGCSSKLSRKCDHHRTRSGSRPRLEDFRPVRTTVSRPWSRFAHSALSWTPHGRSLRGWRDFVPLESGLRPRLEDLRPVRTTVSRPWSRQVAHRALASTPQSRFDARICGRC